MAMASVEISNILRECGCFEYANYLAGIKTKEDLYRFSLKDLAQTLPYGEDAKFAAYTIHSHLVNLQRQEMETWSDPRDQVEHFQFNAPQFFFSQQAAAAATSSNRLRRENAGRNNTDNDTIPSSDGRSRDRESKYKSSPHIICTTDSFNHKLYLCRYCDKRFSVPNQAVIHTRKHTGEKPYSCHVCDKRFTQISSRNLHVKKEHGSEKVITTKKRNYSSDPTAVKPYPCAHCEKSYSQISSRNLHVRNQHPNVQ